MSTIKRKKKLVRHEGLVLKPNIEPITKAQVKVFDSYSTKNLLIIGAAGSGKSYVSIYLALKSILNSENETYTKLILIRSTVTSRDTGFLPGTLEEKIAPFEAPYVAICADLFEGANHHEAYEMLKNRGVIDFQTTGYLRGLTFDNAIIVVDEIQNTKFSELLTIITRIGKNSKIILCGDLYQNDLTVSKWDQTGFPKFHEIIKTMSDDFAIVECGLDDICRSGIVKRFLVALYEYEKLYPYSSQ